MMKYAVVAVGLSLFPVQASAHQMSTNQCAEFWGDVYSAHHSFQREYKNLGNAKNKEERKEYGILYKMYLDRGAKLSQIYQTLCPNQHSH